MNLQLKWATIRIVVLLIAALAMVPYMADAQRLPRNTSRPSTSKRAPSRPSPSRATTPSRPSINGGSRQSPTRPVSKPTDTHNRAAPAKSKTEGSPGTVKAKAQNVDKTAAKSKVQNADKDAARAKVQNVEGGDKINIGNNSNIGNEVNINTGDKDVNINIDNSKDININRNSNNRYYRPSPYPYRRPPYTYGGFHFYCHFGYSYHPFTPYYWGPSWHPWGFFIATLTATAIVVSANNQQYHYDQGVFYEEGNGGYTAVEAPNGAVVPEIPQGAEQVTIEQNVTNNYYYGGTYYEKGEDGYTVVPPTAGAVVQNLPEGAEEVKVGDVTYVKYGDTYYQPVQVEGQDKYEVAQVEPAE